MPARVMAPKGTNDQEWWPYHYNTAVYSDDVTGAVEDGAEIGRAMAARLLERAGDGFFDWK